MNSRTSTQWLARVTPTGLFAILSLIVVGLITAALSFGISYYLRKDLLDREWKVTADFIRTQAAYHLAPSDFDDSSSLTAQEHFRIFYQQTVMMPEIRRVKIYDPTTAVIWSDEVRLVGQRFPDNPHLVDALTGRTVVNIGEGEKREHMYERDAFPYLVEVYVPIVFPGTSRLAGVVETYKVPKRVFANIRKGQITVASTTLAGGILLYISLFWIFRRATRQIEGQRQALEQGSRELVSANQELRAVQAHLLETERMAAIGEVVTAVAHGIRNPLATIRASAQAAWLECGACTVSVLGPRNLANTLDEVDQLEGRLRELLQFVRPEERKFEPVDLNMVLRKSLRMMVTRIGNARININEQLAPVLPPIMGNAMLVEQIFLSLIDNAIEAMPGGDGTITLITGAEQDNGGAPQVFAEVQDTGVGIPQEKILKILESFYTTKAHGTGLGLAIAVRFTEACGGSLSVSSRPGEGANFRTTFPAHQEV